ncbi:nucleotidyltransferase domain-containing protein [Actinospica robiniae]|uniref:nucleotidyltransferase domain-containing protein n=1 Tax=Actinospica robiniae TaxID=304901 RepID=UPI0003F75E17|nr:nucleotidyltransferase domain-containing protein [Actinospica robiniae]
MDVLLSGIVGSTAYGLAGPDSDVDHLGMFALPTIELVGLGKPQLSRVAKNPDSTWHEAGKAVGLFLAGNPTAMELLWLPDDLYEARTPLGDEAIALRSRFLSAHRVKDAYLGYATHQFRKLQTRYENDEQQRARDAKHARHLMRLVEQGYELYTTGNVRIRLEDPQRFLDFGATVAEDARRAMPIMAKAQDRFSRARTVLPQEPDFAAAEDWLLRVRREFWE